MTTFELPKTEGKPSNIVDFEVDLLLSPPEIKERVIDNVDNYISAQPEKFIIEYKNASVDEGRLNIYICQFNSVKYQIHVFGRIRGKEFRMDKEIRVSQSNSLGIHNIRIKYILINSRRILRNYYLNSNLKSIEDHLMSFLLPL
ncbi:MAG: hypothetical protein ABIP51_16200 [Bacteroidia bacterium]